MTSFFPKSDKRRVFGIPPGCDFSVAFLDGLKERLSGQPPEAIARVEIYTNTRRAARRWEELFLNGQASLLPQIKVITDIVKNPVLGLKHDPAETELSKQLIMMQAVRKLLESGQSTAPVSAAFDLAGSLNALMDEIEGEGLEPGALSTLDISDHSTHWQTALQFLQIIEDTSIGKSSDALGAEAMQRLAVEKLSAIWAEDPPQHPVLVAGSTGSRGTTARLMDAVLNLPQGGIVLPGFDFELKDDIWDNLTGDKDPSIDHPQFGFAQLSKTLDFSLGDVAQWGAQKPAAPTRNALVSLAMRPAPVTDQWLSEGPAHEGNLDQSTKDLALIEAPNERAEAASIAIALREAVEHGKRAVLITPDATLSRRVTTNLERWGIVPDDSAGVPLRFTPPAIFLDLVLQTAREAPDTASFAAVLKHPLCASEWDRGKHLRLTRRLDVKVLRDIGPRINWDAIREWSKEIEDAPEWVEWLRAVFIEPTHSSLSGHAEAHREAASKLVSGPNGSSDAALWDKNAGETAATIFDQLAKEDAFAGDISDFEYKSIFRALVGKESVREEGFIADKRVAIWGQLEARVQSADLVILGGLNEGTWPKLPPPDPWLSRPMRGDLGLQLPERRIGLSAHDFQQAIANGEVILSRSQKEDNTPTVASRWLTRLDNLLQGIGVSGEESLKQMRSRGQRFIELSKLLDKAPEQIAPEPRPCPAPPVAKRPNRISVTQVERLIRDPYSVYAEKVLGLRSLPVMGRTADARDRGTSFHKVLENFIDAVAGEIPENARQVFDDIAKETLTNVVPWAAERRIWLGRLSRIANSFIAREHERREIARPSLREVKGSIKIPDTSRALSLTCQADRIDVSADGTIAIYDYKSSLPTNKQEQLFSKQLELEAHMAMKGGFEDLGKVRTKYLEIIGLSKANSYLPLDCDPDTIADMWTDFLKIIAHFEAPENGYAARLRPMQVVPWGDYDHLARRGEWEDNADLSSRPIP